MPPAAASRRSPRLYGLFQALHILMGMKRSTLDLEEALLRLVICVSWYRVHSPCELLVMVLKDDKWHKKAKRATEHRKGKKFEKKEKSGHAEQPEPEDSASDDEHDAQHARRKVVSNAWRYEASASSGNGSEEEEAPAEPDYARMKSKEFVLRKSKYDTDSSDDDVVAGRRSGKIEYVEAKEFEALQQRIDRKKKLDSLKKSFAASSPQNAKQHQPTLNADNLESFLDGLL